MWNGTMLMSYHIKWHYAHVISHEMALCSCHITWNGTMFMSYHMKWHYVHVISHEMALCSCHITCNGTMLMSYNMKWHNAHVISHEMALCSCHTTWNGTMLMSYHSNDFIKLYLRKNRRIAMKQKIYISNECYLAIHLGLSHDLDFEFSL